MDYTGILDSAVRLKKNSLYKVTISESVREILYQLNTLIHANHDSGLSRAEMRLPINFKQVDDSISNEELQTAIYFAIATELEKKDYKVRFQFCKTFTLMKVSWTVKAESDELTKMRSKLMRLRE